MLCQAWLLKKGVVLTIKDANGIATKPQYRARPDLAVKQLKRQLSVLPASPFVDGDELRVLSSPMQSRPLDNMEETLWATDAHGLSVGISHVLSSNPPDPSLVLDPPIPPKPRAHLVRDAGHRAKAGCAIGRHVSCRQSNLH